MDFLDEVLNLEETAFRAGEELGKIRAKEESKKQSLETGKENGFYIAKEYGYIIGFTRVVNMEEHMRERQLKVIEDILSVEINPQLPYSEINEKMLRIRNLFKVLLNSLKLKPPSTPSELF